MPYKNADPVLPFLDPQYDPNHPLNNLPQIEEDPYLPLSKGERKRRQRELVHQALEHYVVPHVQRSWEVDTYRAETRRNVLKLQLSDRPQDLIYRRGIAGKDGIDRRSSIGQPTYQPDSDDKIDFRRFAERTLHLGYWRIHASVYPHDGETPDPPETMPDEVCWILEYTLPECNTIRRRIARAMGIFPAAIDNETPFFDENIAYAYGHGRRLFARCRRWNKRCIRPSHIVISTFSNILLP